MALYLIPLNLSITSVRYKMCTDKWSHIRSSFIFLWLITLENKCLASEVMEILAGEFHLLRFMACIMKDLTWLETLPFGAEKNIGTCQVHCVSHVRVHQTPSGRGGGLWKTWLSEPCYQNWFSKSWVSSKSMQFYVSRWIWCFYLQTIYSQNHCSV